MATLEVLIAAMNQNDFGIIEKSNITTNAIIANQTNCNYIKDTYKNSSLIKMISSDTQGVGKNRNIALEFAKGDIILFGDDDCVYVDGYNDIILNEFEHNPMADVILFGVQLCKDGEIKNKRLSPNGRINVFQSLKYGTVSIAIKKQAIDRYNLHFSELFGGGCLYSHGEDTDFLFQCFKKGLKVFACDTVICVSYKDSSSCFDGYNRKYFFDIGALAKHTFGIMALPYIFYMAFRINETSISIIDKIYYGFRGYLSLNSLTPFSRINSRR